MTDGGSLDEGDVDGDGVPDEVVVNWSLKGVDSLARTFKVVPTSDVFYYSGTKIVNYPYDNNIRMSSINKASAIASPGSLKFAGFSPVL
jgi:hypothetical protein